MRSDIVKASAIMAIVLLLSTTLLISQMENQRSDLIYQAGIYQGLLDGDYTGDVKVEELLRQGDVGLGTFNSLDGEMIILDGACYQVTHDGVVHVAPGENMTPFASVTYMRSDQILTSPEIDNYSELRSWLSSKMGNDSFFIVFLIEGTFPELTCRSVGPAQVPFPPLLDMVANQTVFHYQNVSGTLVGIFSPSDIGSIDAPGFHFHFLSSDLQKGGHVLEVSLARCEVLIDHKSSLELDGL
jgi:acetolactate decarboxylase